MSPLFYSCVSLLFFPSAFPHLHAWCYCQYSTCFRKEAPLHRWVKTRSGGNLKSRTSCLFSHALGIFHPPALLHWDVFLSPSPLLICSSGVCFSYCLQTASPPPQCPPGSPFCLRTPLSNTPLILSSSRPPVAPPHPPPPYLVDISSHIPAAPLSFPLDPSQEMLPRFQSLVPPGPTRYKEPAAEDPRARTHPGLKGERRGRQTLEQPLGSGRSTGPLDNSEKGPRNLSPGTALSW